MFERVKSKEEIYKIGSIHRMNSFVTLMSSDEGSKESYNVKIDAPVRIIEHIGLEKVIVEDANGTRCYAQLKDIGEKETVKTSALPLMLSRNKNIYLAVRYILFMLTALSTIFCFFQLHSCFGNVETFNDIIISITPYAIAMCVSVVITSTLPSMSEIEHEKEVKRMLEENNVASADKDTSEALPENNE